MAYDFNGVLGQLGKKRDDQQQPDQAAIGGAFQRSSTEGDQVAGGAGGAGGGAPPPNKSDQQLPAGGGTRRAVFSRNNGRQDGPVDAQALDSGIKAATGSVKTEEQNYLGNAASAYGSGSSYLTGAQRQGLNTLATPTTAKDPKRAPASIDGLGDTPSLPHATNPPPPPGGTSLEHFGDAEKAAYNPAPVVDTGFAGTNWNDPTAWSGLLNATPGQIRDIALTTPTDFSQANMLGTDAGERELFKKQGGAEYTAGDAAFDTALTRGNAGYQQQRGQVAQDYHDLNAAKDYATSGRARDDARQKAAGGLETLQGQARDALGGRMQSLEDQATARKGQYDPALKASMAAAPGAMKASTDQAYQELLKTPEGAAEADNLKQLTGGDVNPADYYKSTGLRDTNWQDFVSDPESHAFDNLYKALGIGGDVHGAGKLAGHTAKDAGNDAFTFDSPGYQKALLGSVANAKRQTASTDEGTISKKVTPAATTTFPSESHTIDGNVASEGKKFVGGAVDATKKAGGDTADAAKKALDDNGQAYAGKGDVANAFHQTLGMISPTKKKFF